jgi:hypothetical protein
MTTISYTDFRRHLAAHTDSVCDSRAPLRITGEHRLVYRVAGNGEAQQLEIVACRYHYGSVTKGA